MLEPKGGEFWSGSTPMTVIWSVIDADGDSPHAWVYYSSDNGDTWYLVADEVLKTSITVNPQRLRGGSAVKFKVIATDGVNTAVAESGVFAVENKPPDALIISPEEGQVFSSGSKVKVETALLDLEDGDISAQMNVTVVNSQTHEQLYAGNDTTVILSLADGSYTVKVEGPNGSSKSRSFQVGTSSGTTNQVYLPLIQR